ncbi:MAG: aminotransferase class V-fold PLP-dependent enzyme [Clostridia bacterium]|nr:aminotransferase class V-fold PLP-dependent enzyme [Clostridia bacterium]
MDTPIIDFVKNYNEAKTTRFHMPGHKGVSFLGFESLDITEIGGADDLSCPEGIIKKSEENASQLFNTKCTVFSTGGSTQSINAMLYLAFLNRDKNVNPVVLAGRNAHKAFMFAAAKIGFSVEWLYPDETSSLCSAIITAEILERQIKNCQEKPFAVYITSPDYLGNITDIKALSAVCKKYNVPLLVDNAHGAYSAFLKDTFHPILSGADMCCDSAHKTLPALTGSGYIHIEKEDRFNFSENIHEAMTIFGSSSPSYLLLQSLDLCNKYISEKIRYDLEKCQKSVEEINDLLKFSLIKNISQEPLKITLDFTDVQKNGFLLSEYFRKYNIEFEYCDEDYVVFMVTPQNSDEDFLRLKEAILNFPEFKMKEEKETFNFVRGNQKMSIREAVFSKSELVPVDEAVGRICSVPTVSCPPAIPIVVSGEEITSEHIKLLKRYGKKTIKVVNV